MITWGRIKGRWECQKETGIKTSSGISMSSPSSPLFRASSSFLALNLYVSVCLWKFKQGFYKMVVMTDLKNIDRTTKHQKLRHVPKLQFYNFVLCLWFVFVSVSVSVFVFVFVFFWHLLLQFAFNHLNWKLGHFVWGRKLIGVARWLWRRIRS